MRPVSASVQSSRATLRHVGLNLLYLVPGETGGSETYARELIPELLAAAPQVHFTAFVNDEGLEGLRGDPWANGVAWEHIRVSGRNRLARALAEQTRLPRRVSHRNAQLLHGLASTAPRFLRATSVVTILDLIFLTEPEAHTRLMRGGMATLVPMAARHADRVIAISNAARDDIVARLRIDPERVDVTHLGVGMTTLSQPTAERELRRRLELGDSPLVLSVSAKRPHKNLERLIGAFARVHVDPPPVLVLPGYPTPFEAALRERAHSDGVAERVKIVGWLSEADLEGLYRAARCFVFPSLREGFGLPVLEAMRRELPVACSNTSSLPEVAGDAALSFDPKNIEQIAGAIERLMTDDQLVRRLVVAGTERCTHFSWARTARATLETYRRAATG